MSFRDPLFFLLLLGVPFWIFFRLRTRRGGALTFSATGPVLAGKSSLRQRLTPLPFVLRIAAVVFLVVAVARPQSGREPIRKISEGVAIEMVIDRSGSMKARMEYREEQVSRFEVVRKVFEEFVRGNEKDLEGRENDLIGVISFAKYPDTISPLTLSHDTVLGLLNEIDIVKQFNQDGTAIGEAVALAAARLKTAEEEILLSDDREDYRIKSKVIILLTDGQNNAGERTPEQATELAREWGIKIYTIGIGGGRVNYAGGRFENSKQPLLEGMAERTGGIFRSAEDAESLLAVYGEIDKLEKSDFESLQYMSFSEWFSPFAFLALALIIGELALSHTLLRKLP
jgi:Ca-activated chloride channel family protein